MEFENLIMRVILRYCDEAGMRKIGAEEAWELSKIIALIAKPKSKKEIYKSQEISHILGKLV